MPNVVRTGVKIALAVVALILVVRFFAKPASPAAILRVVDAAGQPVSGATIRREGMRTKPGAYRSGWYGWMVDRHVPNPPVITDANGEATIEYPEYVFEKVETGVVCLAVEHPDFVYQRAERDVDTSLPENAPTRDRVTDIFQRILNNSPLTSRPDPIVLKKGGILKITVPPESRVAPDARLWGQVSHWNFDTSFWIHPGPGMIATRRLAEGTQAIRVAQFDTHGKTWFSAITNVISKAGETVELNLTLKPGVALRGKLDQTVPRPVQNGRVILNVLPPGIAAEKAPPRWHAWAKVKPDGNFEFTSLPDGDLEIAAICQGYISTNGPGIHKTHYPQKHTLAGNDLDIVIGMEPTVLVQALVVDHKDQPIPNAKVAAWPNLRWGEWASVIFGSDLYDMGDYIRGLSHPRDNKRLEFPDFEGKTDQRGVAILPNLPLDVTRLAVLHDQFQIPAVETNGRDERSVTVSLRAGQTNYVKIIVEPITEGAKRQHR